MRRHSEASDLWRKRDDTRAKRKTIEETVQKLHLQKGGYFNDPQAKKLLDDLNSRDVTVTKVDLPQNFSTVVNKNELEKAIIMAACPKKKNKTVSESRRPANSATIPPSSSSPVKQRKKRSLANSRQPQPVTPKKPRAGNDQPDPCPFPYCGFPTSPRQALIPNSPFYSPRLFPPHQPPVTLPGFNYFPYTGQAHDIRSPSVASQPPVIGPGYLHEGSMMQNQHMFSQTPSIQHGNLNPMSSPAPYHPGGTLPNYAWDQARTRTQIPYNSPAQMVYEQQWRAASYSNESVGAKLRHDYSPRMPNRQTMYSARATLEYQVQQAPVTNAISTAPLSYALQMQAAIAAAMNPNPQLAHSVTSILAPKPSPTATRMQQYLPKSKTQPIATHEQQYLPKSVTKPKPASRRRDTGHKRTANKKKCLQISVTAIPNDSYNSNQIGAKNELTSNAQKRLSNFTPITDRLNGNECFPEDLRKKKSLHAVLATKEPSHHTYNHDSQTNGSLSKDTLPSFNVFSDSSPNLKRYSGINSLPTFFQASTESFLPETGGTFFPESCSNEVPDHHTNYSSILLSLLLATEETATRPESAIDDQVPEGSRSAVMQITCEPRAEPLALIRKPTDAILHAESTRSGSGSPKHAIAVVNETCTERMETCSGQTSLAILADNVDSTLNRSGSPKHAVALVNETYTERTEICSEQASLAVLAEDVEPSLDRSGSPKHAIALGNETYTEMTEICSEQASLAVLAEDVEPSLDRSGSPKHAIALGNETYTEMTETGSEQTSLAILAEDVEPSLDRSGSPKHAIALVNETYTERTETGSEQASLAILANNVEPTLDRSGSPKHAIALVNETYTERTETGSEQASLAVLAEDVEPSLDRSDTPKDSTATVNKTPIENVETPLQDSLAIELAENVTAEIQSEESMSKQNDSNFVDAQNNLANSSSLELFCNANDLQVSVFDDALENPVEPLKFSINENLEKFEIVGLQSPSCFEKKELSVNGLIFVRDCILSAEEPDAFIPFDIPTVKSNVFNPQLTEDELRYLNLVNQNLESETWIAGFVRSVAYRKLGVIDYLERLHERLLQEVLNRGLSKAGNMCLVAALELILPKIMSKPHNCDYPSFLTAMVRVAICYLDLRCRLILILHKKCDNEKEQQVLLEINTRKTITTLDACFGQSKRHLYEVIVSSTFARKKQLHFISEPIVGFYAKTITQPKEPDDYFRSILLLSLWGTLSRQDKCETALKVLGPGSGATFKLKGLQNVFPFYNKNQTITEFLLLKDFYKSLLQSFE